MVPGLDPTEAVDRLKKFMQMFEVSIQPTLTSRTLEFIFSVVSHSCWQFQRK